ncbi:MAG: hypothetical protein DRP16_04145 [Candidatus Aenigmatarchaeota archaeon]|nr:MAG: hypothetical protein DRP16_04145 [Candidatus Aenigmarchaeota archaeon]
MKLKAVLMVLLFFLLLPCAKAYVFSVRLNINNTDNTVYIPGVGQKPANNLGTNTVYTNPPHFYLASFLNNVLTGLAAGTGNSLVVNTGEKNHSIEITQNLENSEIFLIFTRGNWKNIENVIKIIESGEFLLEVSPTFGFGLGTLYPVKLILFYSELNLTGSVMFGKGSHKLIIENNGFENEKPIINIRSE